MDETKIKVSKLDAAKRQLDAAIELWFYDQDPVAVHTLAAAAYEIIHDINLKKGGSVDLLYDTVMIKDEYRKEYVDLVKKPGNFFKHADRDPEAILEFAVEACFGFFIFSVKGLQNLGERLSDRVGILVDWIHVNRPEWITADKKKALADRLGVEGINALRKLSKREYFEKGLQIAVRKSGAR